MLMQKLSSGVASSRLTNMYGMRWPLQGEYSQVGACASQARGKLLELLFSRVLLETFA